VIETPDPLVKFLRAADLERLRVTVGGTEYDVPIPVGRELERVRAALDAHEKALLLVRLELGLHRDSEDNLLEVIARLRAERQ
jgi:hypothetical protein